MATFKKSSSVSMRDELNDDMSSSSSSENPTSKSDEEVIQKEQ